MDTQQSTWLRERRAAWSGAVRSLLATLLLGLAPWSVSGPHAEGGCASYNFVQPPGSPVGVGVLPRPVAVGDFDLDGKPDLAVADSFRAFFFGQLRRVGCSP
jgi:hypothetical protein